MNGWIIDTSAYSWGLRGQSEIADILRTADILVLPSVVIGELLAGFLKGDQQERNRALLDRFLASPRVEVAELGKQTAERYGFIVDGLRQAGTPIPANDVWIAATAMQLGYPLLSTEQHFAKVSQIVVRLVDPDNS